MERVEADDLAAALPGHFHELRKISEIADSPVLLRA